MGEERNICGARTRNGGVCRKPPTPGKKRCHMHGGKSTGPKNPVRGERSNLYRHGVYCKDLTKEEREIADLDEVERLRMLSRMATVMSYRAFKAQASEGDGLILTKRTTGENGGDTHELPKFDSIFDGHVGAAVRAETAIAAIGRDGQGRTEGDDQVPMHERAMAIERALEGATEEDSEESGASDLDAGQPAADRGPDQSG